MLYLVYLESSYVVSSITFNLQIMLQRISDSADGNTITMSLYVEKPNEPECMSGHTSTTAENNMYLAITLTSKSATMWLKSSYNIY